MAINWGDYFGGKGDWSSGGTSNDTFGNGVNWGSFFADAKEPEYWSKARKYNFDWNAIKRADEQAQTEKLKSTVSNLQPLVSPSYQDWTSKQIKTPEFQQYYQNKPATPSFTQDVKNFFSNWQSPDTARSQAVQKLATSPEYRKQALSSVGEFSTGVNIGSQKLIKGIVDYLVGSPSQELERFGTPEQRKQKVEQILNLSNPEASYPNVNKTSGAYKAGKATGGGLADIAKYAGLLYAAAQTGNANVAAAEATPLFTSLQANAPNIATYASRGLNMGTQGATFTLLNDLFEGKGIEEAGTQAAKFGGISAVLGPISSFVPDVGSTVILKSIPRAITSSASEALIAKFAGYDPISAGILGLFLTGKGDGLAKTKYKWEESGITEAQFNKRMNELNPFLSPENRQRIQDAFDSLSKKEKVFITTDSGIVSEIRKTLPTEEFMQVPTWYGKFANFIKEKVARGEKISPEAANFANDLFLNPDRYAPKPQQIPSTAGMTPAASPMTNAPTPPRQPSPMTAVGKDYNQPLPGQENPLVVENLWERKYAPQELKIQNQLTTLNNQLQTAKGATKQNILTQIDVLNKQSVQLEQSFLAEASKLPTQEDITAASTATPTTGMPSTPEKPIGVKAIDTQKPATFNFGSGDITVEITRGVGSSEKTYKQIYGKEGGIVSFSLTGPGLNSETGFKSVAGVSYQGKMTKAKLNKMMTAIAKENALPPSAATPKPSKPLIGQELTLTRVKDEAVKKIQAAKTFTDIKKLHMEYQNALSKSISDTASEAMWDKFNLLQKEIADAEVFALQKLTAKYPVLREVKNLGLSDAERDALIKAKPKPIKTKVAKPKQVISAKPLPKQKIVKAKPLTEKNIIGAVKAVIPSRTPVPQLKGIAFNGKDIISTDLDNYVVYHGSKDYKPVVVDAKVVADRGLDEAHKIGLENIDAQNNISSSYDEFPEKPKIETKPIGKINPTDVVALKDALIHTSKDNSRPVLASVLIKSSNGKLRSYGTDAYTLSVRDLGSTNLQDGEYIIPASTTKIVNNIMALNPKEFPAISINPIDNEILFKIGNFDIYGKLTIGNYPAVDKILDTTDVKNVTGYKLNVAEVLDALKSAKLKTSEPVIITPSKDKLQLEFTDKTDLKVTKTVSATTLQNQNLGQNNNVIMPMRTEGDVPKGTVHLNPEYLVKTLKNLDYENVSLNYNHDAINLPVFIQSLNEKPYEPFKEWDVQKKSEDLNKPSFLRVSDMFEAYGGLLEEPGKISQEYLRKNAQLPITSNIQAWADNILGEEKSPIILNQLRNALVYGDDILAVWTRGLINLSDTFVPYVINHEVGHHIDQIMLTENEQNELDNILGFEPVSARNFTGKTQDEIDAKKEDYLDLKKEARADAIAHGLMQLGKGYDPAKDYVKENKKSKFRQFIEKLWNRIKQLFSEKKENPLRTELDKFIDNKLSKIAKRKTVIPKDKFVQTAEEAEQLFVDYLKRQGLYNATVKRASEIYDGITTRVLKDIGNKEIVSKEYIKNLSNRPDIKLPERLIIQRALQATPAGDKVSVKEFSDNVKSQLLPLNVKEFVDAEGFVLEKERENLAELIKEKTGLSPVAVGARIAMYEMNGTGPKNGGFSKEIVDMVDKYNLLNERIDYIAGTEYFNRLNTQYSQIVLDSDIRGDVASYKEKIYESPYETPTSSNLHWGGETNNYFAHTRLEEIKSAPKLVGNAEIKVNQDEYQLIADGEVIATSKKRDELVPKYQEIMYGSKEAMKKDLTRRIIEIQSDLWQKGRYKKDFNLEPFKPDTLDREAVSSIERVLESNLTDKQFKEFKDLERKIWHGVATTFGRSAGYTQANRIPIPKKFLPPDAKKSVVDYWEGKSLDYDYRNIMPVKNWVDYAKYEYKNLLKEYNASKNDAMVADVKKTLNVLNKITDKDIEKYVSYQKMAEQINQKRTDELKVLPYKNNWHERIIREEIRDAAKNGSVRKLQFPTGETAMQIEGLNYENNSYHTYRKIKLNPEQAARYRAKYKLEKIPISDIADYHIQTGDMIFVNEQPIFITNYAIDKNTNKLKWYSGVANPDLIIDNDGELYNLAEKINAKKDTSINLNYNYEIIKKNKDMMDRLKSNYSEQWPVEPVKNHPIYDYYENTVQKYLKKIRPDLQRVEDANGVSWFETEITNADKADVIAFVRAGGPIEKEPQKPNQQNAEDAVTPYTSDELTQGNYNTDHINIDEVAKDKLNVIIEEIKPKLEEAIGRKLSNDEVVNLANNTNTVLSRSTTREDTAKAIAANLKLRERIAKAAADGRIDAQFVKDILRDKQAGANIARQLQARRIDADPKEATLIDVMIEGIHKTGADEETVVKAAEKYDLNNYEDQVKFYREFVQPTWEDWLDKLRYNSMLSSPNTHVINTSSNWQGTGLIAPIQKALEGGLDWTRATITRKERERFAGEAGAYLIGYYTNLKNAATNFGKVMKGVAPVDNPDYRLLPLTTKDQKVLRKVEKALDLPMRMLEGMDQFFSTLTEAGAQRAFEYKAKKGTPVGLANLKAKEEAQYRLFRSELEVLDEGAFLNAVGYLANRINSMRNAKNPVVRIAAKLSYPFLKTPTNIVKQGIEYSPLGVLTLPGAKDKTSQLSKMLIGAAVAVMAALFLSASRMTWAEPTDEKKKKAFRSAGMKPYSIKLGNKWYSYDKLHPALGINLAIVASIYDALEKKKITDNQAEAFLTGLAQWGQFIADQSYIKNIGDSLSTLKGNVDAPTQLIGNYTTQLIPYRGFISWVNRLVDNVQRQPNPDANLIVKQLQYAASQIPILSKTVPARTGAKGEELKNTNVWINAFSPVKVSDNNPEYEQYLRTLDAITTLQKQKVNEKVSEAVVANDIDKAKKLADDYNKTLEDKKQNIINTYGGLTDITDKAFSDAEINLTDKSIKARQNYYKKKTEGSSGQSGESSKKSSKGGIISSGTTRGRSGRKRTGRKIAVKKIRTKAYKTKMPTKPKFVKA